MVASHGVYSYALILRIAETKKYPVILLVRIIYLSLEVLILVVQFLEIIRIIKKLS